MKVCGKSVLLFINLPTLSIIQDSVCIAKRCLYNLYLLKDFIKIFYNHKSCWYCWCWLPSFWNVTLMSIGLKDFPHEMFHLSDVWFFWKLNNEILLRHNEIFWMKKHILRDTNLSCNQKSNTSLEFSFGSFTALQDGSIS